MFERATLGDGDAHIGVYTSHASLWNLGRAIPTPPPSPPPTGFVITTLVLPGAHVGIPYSLQLTAANGTAPYKWTKIGKFARGLKLSKSGLISGTPKKVGTSTFTVQASYKTKLPKQKAVWHTATRALSISIG